MSKRIAFDYLCSMDYKIDTNKSEIINKFK